VGRNFPRDDEPNVTINPSSVVGDIRFFENTGSSTSPAFLEKKGANNPFNAASNMSWGDPNSLGSEGSWTPCLTSGDFDGDDDLDMLVGLADGTIRYFKNSAGSSAMSVFTEAVGAQNPFAAVDVGTSACPTCADFNGDSLLDCFVGTASQGILFFQNTGSSSNPILSQMGDNLNPFSSVNQPVEMASSAQPWDLVPHCIDLDGDAKIDCVIGNRWGDVKV